MKCYLKMTVRELEGIPERLTYFQDKISLNLNWKLMNEVNPVDNHALNFLTSLELLSEQRVSQLHIMIGERCVHDKSINYGQIQSYIGI